jgi:hypothetical protein
MPLGVSHAERGEMPDGASDWRRARPELATVFVEMAGCGTGVLLGHWFGGGVGSCEMITVGDAVEGAFGVTLMPGIVGRFFGIGWPIIVALTAAGGGLVPLTIVRSVGFVITYSPGRFGASDFGPLMIVCASGFRRLSGGFPGLSSLISLCLHGVLPPAHAS